MPHYNERGMPAVTVHQACHIAQANCLFSIYASHVKNTFVFPVWQEFLKVSVQRTQMERVLLAGYVAC